jgi:hypothetical protein
VDAVPHSLEISVFWFRCHQASSATPSTPSSWAKGAQQKNRPSPCTPCPITMQPQCSQRGAIRWIAHSKLSNTCTAPAACTSKLMS